MLQAILGDDTAKHVENIDEYMFSMYKPRNFSGKAGAEVQYVKRFEEMYVLIGQHVSEEPAKMSVLRFYQAIESIQRQQKPRKQAGKRK